MLAAARATTAAALILAAVAVAGCGGGGDDAKPKAPSQAEQPKPREPISAQLAPFNRAVATQSCKATQPLVFSFNRGGPRPGAPATASECKGDSKTGFESLRGRPFCCARQYGTGALMERPKPPNNRQYAVWALDGDGRYRFTQILGISGPQIGTPFTRRAEAARIANRFLKTIRTRDCPAMQRLFSPKGSRLVFQTGSPRAACRAVLKGRFLAPALRKSPHVRVQVLGGTRHLAFVGIPTRRIYFTMLLGGASTPTLRVFDVVPSTPVKLAKG